MSALCLLLAPMRGLTTFFATITILAAAASSPIARAELNSQETELASIFSKDDNQERPFAVLNPILSKVARERAQDMADRGYFNHVNPDGNGANILAFRAGYPLPASWLDPRSLNYLESIAAGQTSAKAVWQAWLNSSSHRTHVLGKTDFYRSETSFGVGYAYSSKSQYKHYWVILTAPPQPNESAYVSMVVNKKMLSGSAYPVKVTVRNSGSRTWSAVDGYALKSVAGAWVPASIPLPQTVRPGETATVQFNVTAPEGFGNRPFQWSVAQNDAAFGEKTPILQILVAEAQNNSKLLSQTIPSEMVAGKQYQIKVTLKNTGLKPWRADQSYALGSQSPADNVVWGKKRVALPAVIAPGTNAAFTFRVRAPLAPGAYTMQWQMQQNGSWFGATSESVTVQVVGDQAVR